MPLTHVCIWDSKKGFMRITAEEADNMFEYRREAVFLCVNYARKTCCSPVPEKISDISGMIPVLRTKNAMSVRKISIQLTGVP